MIKSKYLIIYILYLVFFITPIYSSENEKPNAIFGGFLLSGKYSNVTESFPYTTQLIYETELNPDGKSVTFKRSPSGKLIYLNNGSPELFRYFYRIHKKNYSAASQLNLLTDKSGEVAASTGLVLGLALTGEQVRTSTVTLKGYGSVPSSQKHFIWVYLFLDYLLMDFETNTICDCVPMLYTKVWSHDGSTPPSNVDILKYVKRTYMDSEEDHNKILENSKKSNNLSLKGVTSDRFESMESFLISRLSKIKFRPKGFLTIQVTSVDFEKGALDALSSFSGNNKNNLESLIAQMVGDKISNKFAIPVVPYDRNNANAKMSLALPDNSIRTIESSPGFFSVNIIVQNFIANEKTKKETRTETVFLLGAYSKFKVSANNNNIIYFNKAMKHGEYLILMKKMKDTWDFEADYIKLFNILLSKAFSEMKNNSEFFKGVIEPCQ